MNISTCRYFLWGCLVFICSLSADEVPSCEPPEDCTPQDAVEDDYSKFSHANYKCIQPQDDTVPYQRIRFRKFPHCYHVEKRRLVPQKYPVTLCKEEIETFEGIDEQGCAITCQRKVPYYYQVEKCRYVPASCEFDVERYKKEKYHTDDRPHGLVEEHKNCDLVACVPSWLEITFDSGVGIRRDSLQCIANAYNPPGFFLTTDNLKINHMQVIEAGIKGKAIICKAFMVRGSFYAGGISPQGRYVESVLGNTGQSVTFKAKVHGGDTTDCSIGGGLLLPIACGLRMGPTGGWSYNQQRVKMKSDEPIFDGLQYKNRWQGGWLGADALVTFSMFGLHFGYEYHNPNWHASWLMSIPDTPGGSFSDVRRSKKGYGNVVFLDAYTVKLGCLRLDCQVKYQHWKMRDGQEYPKNGSFAELGDGPNEVVNIKRASWQSLEGTIGLGLDF